MDRLFGTLDRHRVCWSFASQLLMLNGRSLRFGLCAGLWAFLL